LKLCVALIINLRIPFLCFLVLFYLFFIKSHCFFILFEHSFHSFYLFDILLSPIRQFFVLSDHFFKFLSLRLKWYNPILQLFSRKWWFWHASVSILFNNLQCAFQIAIFLLELFDLRLEICHGIQVRLAFEDRWVILHRMTNSVEGSHIIFFINRLKSLVSEQRMLVFFEDGICAH
jgi:hypothetical protein